MAGRESSSPSAKKQKLDKPQTVIIEPNGDLYLQVDNAKSESKPETSCSFTEFLVDSKALCRASPVLSKILSASTAPAGPTTQKWLVKLPVNDEASMSMLLYIMHCRFDKVPQISHGINLNDLYEIAILTHTFDCPTVIRPWAKTWLSTTAELVPKASIRQLERISWVAWELGDRELFGKVVWRFVVTLTDHDFTDLGSSTLFRDTREPDGLIGT